ncbi:hypothetical protein AWH62_01000 [Maricaulis sp. W15]|uniref:DUF6950 family protein n=1 Tax=Maricaulis sp. W15 TaxID=1772333 RepID=UPI0009491314|nr:hypothetical protein [Maricaulis sp. W15]OLF81284.1 hypothetical protein AWH62_01000 [Maricaulis sp. W15]
MSHQAKRQRAAQAALDSFLGRPQTWGRHDCAKLIGFTLHQLGVGLPLMKGVRYRSEAGAIRALRRLDLPGLAEGVDQAGLTRIAPARAWLADIVALPAPEPFGASLMINVGNGRLLGLNDGHFVVLQPTQYLAAWRVPVDG